MTGDPFDLQRFLDAQRAAYPAACAELAAGRKRSHWIWFIFPQVAGMGSSANSVRFGISGLPEAAAYDAHPQLGQNLRRCTGLVLERCTAGRDLLPLFASEIDVAKFHASMTLFARAAPQQPVYRQALSRLFEGVEHAETLRRIQGH